MDGRMNRWDGWIDNKDEKLLEVIEREREKGEESERAKWDR